MSGLPFLLDFNEILRETPFGYYNFLKWCSSATIKKIPPIAWDILEECQGQHMCVDGPWPTCYVRLMIATWKQNKQHQPLLLCHAGDKLPLTCSNGCIGLS